MCTVPAVRSVTRRYYDHVTAIVVPAISDYFALQLRLLELHIKIQNYILLHDENKKMASKTLTVTVPEELYAQIEKQRSSGHYSRSEFVREALRRFLNIPSVPATREEIEAIEAGRKAYERGDYITLDDMLKK